MHSLSWFSLCLLTSAGVAAAQQLPVSFTDVTVAAGVAMEHGNAEDLLNSFRQVGGGVAAGDIDDDGWPDLYVIGGDGTRQHLFLNQGDATFVDLAGNMGIDFTGELLAGPVFADIDGDRHLDLFIGTVGLSLGREPRLLRNSGSGSFTEVSRDLGMFPEGPYTSASFGDFDGDGDLDLFSTHWSAPVDFFDIDHLWRNEGGFRFVAADDATNLLIATDPATVGFDVLFSFTGNFADIDNDGSPDILLASDFGLSQVFRNVDGEVFVDITTTTISDENGMGGTVGDFDNDGHLDWFVTSIFDPIGPRFGWGQSGNRLYRNRGDGTFDDVTEDAGVRDGAWGWGTCFSDFNNDGWLDIFHVNGWTDAPQYRWLGTPARLFVNNRDGTFSERATEAGIDDRGNGRGVACFDYDRDGDVDVFVANIDGPVRLFRNDLDGRANFLEVKLVGRPPNTEAIGARVYVRTLEEPLQIRELRAGSNFVSQDPAVAHFGLGNATSADLEIAWPHQNSRTVVAGVAANQHLVIFQTAGDANCDGELTAADLLAASQAVGRGTSPAPCPGGDLNYDGNVDAADLEFAIARLFTIVAELADGESLASPPRPR